MNGPQSGLVAVSRENIRVRASARSAPHISFDGLNDTQNAGRSGRPKIAQRRSGNNCTHGMPAGLPWGMPGIGDVMLGAMQHAPQPGRHSSGEVKT